MEVRTSFISAAGAEIFPYVTLLVLDRVCAVYATEGRWTIDSSDSSHPTLTAMSRKEKSQRQQAAAHPRRVAGGLHYRGAYGDGQRFDGVR